MPDKQADRKKELEALRIRTASYFQQVRNAMLNDEPLNIDMHERPRRAAERMRALAIKLNISADALTKYDDLTKQLKIEEDADAKAERDSRSSKADGQT